MKIETKVKLNAYRIISEKIEIAIEAGYRRAHKHCDNPNEDEIKEQMYNEITNALCDIIDFD